MTSPIALKQIRKPADVTVPVEREAHTGPHDRACVRHAETQLIFTRPSPRPVGLYFIAVGSGSVADPGRTIKPAQPVVGAALRRLRFSWPASALVYPDARCLQCNGRDCRQMRRAWLRLVQYLIAVAIFCCFGAIASWIAFGPGERQFSGTVVTGNTTIDAAIGRTAFGVGAVIIWLCTAARDCAQVFAESSIRAQRAPASSGRQIVRSAKQCCYAKVSCAGLTRRDAAALSL